MNNDGVTPVAALDPVLHEPRIGDEGSNGLCSAPIEFAHIGSHGPKQEASNGISCLGAALVLTSKVPKVSRRRVAIADVRNTFRAPQALDNACVTADQELDI